MIYIGIDPGTKTGIAIWNAENQRLENVHTKKLHEALMFVYDLYTLRPVTVIIEDPTTWKPFKNNNTSNAKIQGAGSIKRDFSIWKEFCEDYKIPMIRVKLQGAIKKVSPNYFKMLTGFQSLTSEHGRDAAMLVYGLGQSKKIPESVSM